MVNEEETETIPQTEELETVTTGLSVVESETPPADRVVTQELMDRYVAEKMLSIMATNPTIRNMFRARKRTGTNNLSPKEWLHRKKKLKMTKESRRKNRA